MAIVLGLENLTFFWPKVTFLFLNVPMYRGGGVGPPAKEIFLNFTNFFNAFPKGETDNYG